MMTIVANRDMVRVVGERWETGLIARGGFGGGGGCSGGKGIADWGRGVMKRSILLWVWLSHPIVSDYLYEYWLQT